MERHRPRRDPPAGHRRGHPAAVVLAAAGLWTSVAAVTPDRATLEAHLDRSVEAYGRWAVVRLPVTRGVPVWNPTTVRLGDDGSVWAANYTGEVYRLIDTDADGLEDTARLFCNVTRDGLRHPMTLLPVPGGVLVGTSSEVRLYEGGEAATRSRTVLRLPDSGFTYDWAFGLCRTPDGTVHLALPTDSYNPAPAPDPGRWRGAVLRLEPDGKPPTVVATGLRFPYGMTSGPDGRLWLTDNEGGGNPTEELNAIVPGAFYGHNPAKYRAREATGPTVRLTGGRGAAGLAFNPAGNDFSGTAGDLFIAFWGADFAWEEGSLSRVRFSRLPDGTEVAREVPVARRIPKAVDLAFSPAGDLYVASYGRGGYNNTPGDGPSGGFYRLIAAGWVTAAAPPPPVAARKNGDPSRGGEVFQRAGCATCHAVDGVSERFGPNLAGIGTQFTQGQVLAALRNPSESIRTGFEGFRVRTDDGQDLAGWIVTSDPDGFTLRVGPDSDVRIDRSRIIARERMTTSLMPPGLVDTLGPGELDDLLAYLGIPEPVAAPVPTLRERVLHRVHKTGPPMRLRHKLGVLGAAAVLLTTGITLALIRWLRRSCRAS